MTNELEQNIEAFETAAMIAETDFSQLAETDFAQVETDENGRKFGMVQGVAVAIAPPPPQIEEPATPDEGSIHADIRRGLVRGALRGAEALNETLPLLGKPVDWMSEWLGEVGDYIGLDLSSDNPLGGSRMIRDGVIALINFGNQLLPQSVNEAYSEYVNKPPKSPIVQNIVEEITRFGVQAVTPALYLRAFTVMSPFARGLAWGGIADFINAQPDDKSATQALTELLAGATEQERGAFANAVLKVFAVQEGDPEFINRARMALDGMIIGGSAEKILGGVPYLIRAVRTLPVKNTFDAIGGAAVLAARGVDQALDRAKFDYADALADNRGQISWESIPGRTSGHMPQMFSAPYKQQAEYHVAVSRVFLDENGDDIIAKRLGILSPGDFEAPGFFQGKVSPGSQTIAVMPRQYKGAATGSVEPASQELIAAYAAVRGILLKQDGVGWHRPFYKALKRDENGIVLKIGRQFSEAETKRLGDIMAELAGHGEYNPIASADGVRLLNFDFARRVPDGEGGFKPVVENTHIDADKLLTNEEFGRLVDEAIDRLQLDDDLVVDLGGFHAATGYSSNDWRVKPNGEDYWTAISSEGRSDLQGRVRDLIRELHPRIDEIDRSFSERYGWTINDAINARYRGGAESGSAGRRTQAEITTRPNEAPAQNPPSEAGFSLE
jgi:hypothetical protein